jgi:competence protein ComEA
VRAARFALVAAAIAALPGLGHAATPGAALVGQVNVNTATAFELAQLPGIGPRKAQWIVEHRSKRPFRFPEQIVKVRGIGRAMFRRLKPFLAVEGETTLRLVEAPGEQGGEEGVTAGETPPAAR